MSNQAVPVTGFEVKDEPALFDAVRWVSSLNYVAKARVIETVAGPYGAIDQAGGTNYFDVGDVLVNVFDMIVVVKPKVFESETVELEDEDS